MVKWHNVHSHRKKAMVQDAFIIFTGPVLLLIGMLIAFFLSLH